MAISTLETTDQPAPWDSKKNETPKHHLRRSLPWLALAALVTLIVWGLQPKPVLVETGHVTRGPLTVRITEEGKTRVKNRYVVAAPVAGIMRRVALKAGDEVTADSAVLTTIESVAAPLLDPRAVMQAEAAISLREASRSQAVEALEAKKAAAGIANSERDRIRAVLRAGTISESDRDRAEGEASMKSNEVRAAEFALKVSEYELVQARAVLQRPTTASAGNLVAVKSPVSGRVLRVMEESERYVNAGTPILEIGDPADFEIEAEILSRDAVAIRSGDSVEIEQWGGVSPLKARVRRIEPAAFTKVSALGVEEQRVMVLSDLLEVPESAKQLGDRFRVEARIAVWHGDDVLSVPAGAIFREGNVWKTYGLRGGKAVLIGIEAGHSDGRMTEILAGLQVGDEVLLHPPDTVKDGTRVVTK